MKKILLVEDDKSLREIYAVRLIEEGYDIVSAGDGEQALAMAIKERPVLIISDVMMPKISGFDMLDILRSTTETKDIKVIIMTALSSEDQRARGEQLGADKYLVKSQVGIEDVVHAVHEVLRDTSEAATPAAAQAPAPAPAASTTPPQPSQPQPIATPRPTSPVVPERPAPTTPTTTPAASPPAASSLPQPTNTNIASTTSAPQAPAMPPVSTAPTPAPAPQPATPASQSNVPIPSGSSARIIEPLSSLDDNTDGDALAAMIDKELDSAPAPQPQLDQAPSLTPPAPVPAPDEGFSIPTPALPPTPPTPFTDGSNGSPVEEPQPPRPPQAPQAPTPPQPPTSFTPPPAA